MEADRAGANKSSLALVTSAALANGPVSSLCDCLLFEREAV